MLSVTANKLRTDLEHTDNLNKTLNMNHTWIIYTMFKLNEKNSQN